MTDLLFGGTMLTMDKIKTGWEGEGIIRRYLEKKHIHYMQADILAKAYNNQWHILEIKHQEMFERPPFDGHGLPRWQIEARLKFQQDTGIKAILIIVDKITKVVYWQYMDNLINGEQFQTKGSSPRLIFPLESFKVIRDITP